MPTVPLLVFEVSHGTVAAEAETMGGSRVKGDASETGGPQIGSMLNQGLWRRDKAFDQPVFLLKCYKFAAHAKAGWNSGVIQNATDRG